MLDVDFTFTDLPYKMIRSRFSPHTFIIFLLSIFNHNIHVSSILSPQPGNTSIILVKTKQPPRDNNFNYFTPSCTHFKDFLTDTNHVVDKSLLIQEIVSCFGDILLISAPATFGKTANLGMIQLFFEYQIKDDELVRKEKNSGYTYFKYGRYFSKDGLHVFSSRPLISQHSEFLEQYQGNHPVIYFDFKPTNGASYPNKIEFIKRIICEKISQEFKRHFYVQKYFVKLVGNAKIENEAKQRAQQEWKRFEMFALNRQLDWNDMAESFRFLSQVLFKFFGTKVVILMDDMDFLINHVKEDWIYLDEPRPKTQDLQVIDFLCNFINSTFNGNEKLMKIVITGRTHSCIDELFKSVNRSAQIFDGINNEFDEFYGFTESVSEQLLKIGNVSQEQTAEAIDQYRGYKFNIRSNYTIFCPWDIIQTMEKKLISDYWVRENSNEKIRNLIILKFMKPVIEILLKGESISVLWTSVRFESHDFERIFNLVNERIARPTANDIDLVLKCFHAAGYVTSVQVQHMEERLANCSHVKVPNHEISNGIRKIIRNRQENIYNGG